MEVAGCLINWVSYMQRNGRRVECKQMRREDSFWCIRQRDPARLYTTDGERVSLDKSFACGIHFTVRDFHPIPSGIAGISLTAENNR